MSTALSIIVPCYNEADNLSELFRAFRDVVGTRTDIEVVLVNNGSKDRSAEAFDELSSQPEYSFVRVVNVPVNQGYGFGILSGLREAKGEFLAWTHADLQTDPHDVLLGFEKVMQQSEPAKCFLRGRRIGRPLFDRIFTSGMSFIATLALRSRLYDINAQPKLFHRDLLEHMHDAPWDFSLDLFVLHLANRQGLKILEQPVNFGERKHGEAKGGGSLRGKYKLTKRTFKFIFELRQKLSRIAIPK